uniref:Uncharacterized protein n=1 Tax=Oryza punctata TaxID=4537 RepID=A0A0E0MF91_ORYPU
MASGRQIGRVGVSVQFVFSVVVAAMAMVIAAVLTGSMAAAAPEGFAYKGFVPNQPVCFGSCVPGRSNLSQRGCLKIYQCR